jgi:tight adherence protein C
MILVLIAGIACFALTGVQVTRARMFAERDRRLALEAARSSAVASASEVPAHKEWLTARALSALARLHTRIWPKQTNAEIQEKLLRAGTTEKLTAERFMGLRVLFIGVGFFAGFAVAGGGKRIVLALFFAAAAVYLPSFLLRRAATHRAERINAELPHFIDQLAIAVEAGMAFDAAAGYLCAAGDGPLVKEMGRVLAEMRIGQSRQQALRNFAARVDSDEVTAFVNAVVSSEQLGSPLSAILRAQAADCRHRRRLHAEETAQKAPVKMLFPIVIFIFPVMAVVILGPAILGSHGLL